MLADVTTYCMDAAEVTARAAGITHLFLDCDGVMTDGAIISLPDGQEAKRFDIHDGHGIVLWRRAGRKVGIITGRGGPALERRVEELQVEFLIQKTYDKLAAFEALVEREGIHLEAIAYMGDDVVDLPLLRRVGLAIAPPNAVPEVLEHAHIVTTRSGGNGAVREVIELLLKIQGRWEELMARYLV
jgi:3-deoxy-D-manno-octulosonate 8-phosphate phosphatase (KDO 8-P phosphatase)